jgi:hypothetical protein
LTGHKCAQIPGRPIQPSQMGRAATWGDVTRPPSQGGQERWPTGRRLVDQYSSQRPRINRNDWHSRRSHRATGCDERLHWASLRRRASGLVARRAPGFVWEAFERIVASPELVELEDADPAQCGHGVEGGVDLPGGGAHLAGASSGPGAPGRFAVGEGPEHGHTPEASTRVVEVSAPRGWYPNEPRGTQRPDMGPGARGRTFRCRTRDVVRARWLRG